MKRIHLISSMFIILFVLLGARVYNLSVINNKTYLSLADKQTTVNVKLGGGRGNILDRNFLSFTNAGRKKTAVVVKSKNNTQNFEICAILDDENPYSLYNTLYKYGIAYKDVSWDYNENLVRDYNNVCFIEDIKRYEDKGADSAVIGYTMDGRGVSGIEYIADRYLRGKGEWFYPVSRDATGNFLPGISFEKEKNERGMMLKTTLDKKIIEICSEKLKDKKGAAVIIKIPEFYLTAMVSSPGFNRNKIENYLNDSDNPLINRATANYDLGSVFKIVVTAAALENNSVKKDEKFNCVGIKNVGDVKFLCENHPYTEFLTLNDAFKHSCNSVFIDIGAKTRYNNIIDMASAFGINQKLIYPFEFPQSDGILPDKENYYLADLANISIGQGKLMGTVVHAAYFSAIIASGGVKDNINVLDCLLDSDKNKKVSLKFNLKQRVISQETADYISEMMTEVVEGGTGTRAKSDIVSIAGKTGSAQTGIRKDGTPFVHAWFTGFFPAESPEYALCVFIEDGKSGGVVAAPVFKEIAEAIAELEGW